MESRLGNLNGQTNSQRITALTLYFSVSLSWGLCRVHVKITNGRGLLGQPSQL